MKDSWFYWLLGGIFVFAFIFLVISVDYRDRRVDTRVEQCLSYVGDWEYCYQTIIKQR